MTRRSSATKRGVDCFLIRKTDFQWVGACWSSFGLAAFVFGRETPTAVVGDLAIEQRSLRIPTPEDEAQLDRLIETLSGKRIDALLDVALDLSDYTEFQRRVVQACREIPRGETLSYGQLAAKAGSPKAARAVGNIMAKNRFPLIVPCHRVVAANSLGGFSAPDGLSLKRRMLRLEGALPSTSEEQGTLVSW